MSTDHEETNEDTVARRIVMRREIWDELVHLADALRDLRGIEVTPTDVATIALEAGLAEVRRSEKSGSGAKGRSGANSRSATATRSGASGAGSRSGAFASGSGRGRRPAAAGRIDLDADEKSELDALVSAENSARGRQRTIALWLGVRRRKIEVEHLRQLALGYEAYNVANFAQNMKKDGLYFEEVTQPDGSRAGWRLTADGKREAKALCKTALAAV